MNILIAGLPELTQNYENALKETGVLCCTSLIIDEVSAFDALLLPGGGDIEPMLFGQQNQGSRNIDGELDRIQLAILNRCVMLQKPVLGICKGLQLINIYFGGTMIQDLSTSSRHQYRGQDQIHMTTALPGSFLEQLYGPVFTVNSAHHQGIDFPGKDLLCIQHAEDGVTEAILHRRAPILGVQWHPERMCFSLQREDTVDGSLLLRYFTEKMCRF